MCHYGNTKSVTMVWRNFSVTRRVERWAKPPTKPIHMTQVSKEELDTLMHRWIAYAESVGFDRSSERFADAEKMFLLGAFSGMLELSPAELTNEMVPPIVSMCWQSGRPVSSVGNWDKDAPDQRLAGASLTWAQRVQMFPRGGEE